MKNILLISVFAGIFIIGGIYFLMSIVYQNEEIALRETILTKIEDNKSNYTKMWEIITKQADVSAKYADDFKEIYPSLIEGRYDNGGGQMMQWIQEHNPEFDTGLYSKLMVSIEAQRESFHNTQKQLLDLSRQHNTLLHQIPSRWFLGGIEQIEIPIVINDAAEEAFATGKEPTMELF